MQLAKVIQLSEHRKKVPIKKKRSTKKKTKGSVYARSGKLWVDFRYSGERVREPSGLDDTRDKRKALRRQLDLVIAEIDNGLFKFGKRFPQSKKKEYFSELEGNTVTKEPKDITFGNYAANWFKGMQPGMSISQARDYEITLRLHLLPYFAKLSFHQLNTVRIKKFVAHLKGKKNRYGKPLSAKRILNIMIPLRVIVRDCIDEHGWTNFPDPFSRLKLPRPKKKRVQPLNFDEWDHLIQHIPEWYRLYFQFAVQTGLRPSEQVALKWDSIDDEYIHIELSRVRNIEKDDLKTHGSTRMIPLRPTLRRILDEQKELTKDMDSPYVFMNSYGRPIQQDKLRVLWERSLRRAKLPYRRMYETRHTFASWALTLGESPEWVARILGHVDTSMVYKTYGRYIPNLTKMDGSAIERQFSKATDENSDQVGHNFGHNCAKPAANGKYLADNPGN